MAKKRTATLFIEDIRFPNTGVAYENGDIILIDRALPGQTVEATVTRKCGRLTGLVNAVIKKSPDEIDPCCPDFDANKCGGCAYQHMAYPNEIALKARMLRGALADYIADGVWQGVEPAPFITAYRNKMEFAFGDAGKDSPLALGIRKRDSYYEVVTPAHCTIIHDDFKKILLAVLAFFRATDETFYRRTSHTGTLRHLVLRRGANTGELLAMLVTTDGLQTDLTPLSEKLAALETEGRLVGFMHLVNNALSDTVKADAPMRLFWGRDFYYEKLCGLCFKVSVFAFFQTFPAAAEKLYGIIADFLGKAEVVYDLYCGTGTIAQIVSKNAHTVVGVELSEDATAAAVTNAYENGITNCHFVAGDVLQWACADQSTYTQPDVIILDPPRDGIHPKALPRLIAMGAPRIIYVSCKPTSLARDLAVFTENGYRVIRMAACDMFPRTAHVECVALLVKG